MSSTFAVDGLASGLDTRGIISQLLALERRPIDQLKSQQTREQTRQKAMTQLKSQVSVLASAVAALADRAKINAKSAATDTPSSSPTVLAATAGADAVNGTFKVTVAQLATSTSILSLGATATGAIGRPIDATATLANAGFKYVPVNGTFSINGQTITTTGATTLNSLLADVNGAGAGVTASLTADGNRVQLVSAPGQAIQLGALGDTSNALRLMNLSDAVIQGDSKSSTNSGVAASAGTLGTSVTINGVTTAITQTDGAFTSQQNAQFIANAINANGANTVTARAEADGTITLEHKQAGASYAIDVTAAGAGTGLAAGLTKNGTDKVVSTANLGVTDVSAAITSSRLQTAIAGLDGTNSGSFKINGVEITYKGSESLSAILNRINASSAGVTAFYDPVQDKIRLTAGQTGARAITMSDTTGNFLAATSLTGGAQTLGQNALFSIDSVNGGAQLSSATNSVSGYLPGISLDLKSVSATPVTVTVSQNGGATTDTLRSFVEKFNAVADAVENLTKYDKDTKKSSTLTGERAVSDMQRQLRSLVNSAALGVTGKYRSLADIGVSTGAIGAKLGSTGRLQLDEAKLAAAMRDNPQAVENVLASFSATLGAPSGPNVTTVSGTPTQQHEAGTYKVKVVDASNNVEVSFLSPDGRTLSKSTGILTPGQANTSLIAGLSITAAGTLTVGAEDTFAMTPTQRGVGIGLNDYLDKLLGANGFFATRETASTSQVQSMTDRIVKMEERLKVKEASLQRKFTALEAAMSRMQSQGAALSSQIAKLNAPSE